METVAEAISGVVLAVAVGMMGVLVSRRRKHLRLVVRVLDQRDQHLLDFLDQLVQSGELKPALAT
jgi:hypothetical protein